MEMQNMFKEMMGMISTLSAKIHALKANKSVYDKISLQTLAPTQKGVVSHDPALIVNPKRVKPVLVSYYEPKEESDKEDSWYSASDKELSGESDIETKPMKHATKNSSHPNSSRSQRTRTRIF